VLQGTEWDWVGLPGERRCTVPYRVDFLQDEEEHTKRLKQGQYCELKNIFLINNHKYSFVITQKARLIESRLSVFCHEYMSIYRWNYNVLLTYSFGF